MSEQNSGQSKPIALDCALGAYRLPKPPKLEELRSRPCTLEELQAAFVNLVDLYNEQGKVMEAAINRKQDREWRATI